MQVCCGVVPGSPATNCCPPILNGDVLLSIDGEEVVDPRFMSLRARGPRLPSLLHMLQSLKAQSTPSLSLDLFSAAMLDNPLGMRGVIAVITWW